MPRRKRSDDEKEGPQKGRQTTDREISEFLLRACHDLRTPLRAIRAHAELLLKGTADFEQRLGFIIDGARKIDLLVEGISSYSIALQIEGAAFQSTRMDVMLRTVLAKLGSELRDNEAEVTYEELPRVMGQPDRLMQVFENLLRNALRHRGEAPPRIHITAEKREGVWLFAVRDNGPGVEADYLKDIFKPFVRLDGKEHAGAGLGLAICREIVERHGGSIWAESKTGTGSTFFFTLPAD